MDLIRMCGHKFDPSLFREEPLLIDCGAFKAVFTIEFIKRYGGSALIFEPNPRVAYPLLTEILKDGMIGRITMSPMALSDTTGYANFNIMSQGSSLIDREGKWDEYVVPTITLKRVLSHIDYVDMLKMDIEGSEFVVLKAAREQIRKIKQISVELHQDLDGKNNPSKIIRLFEKRGFSARVVKRNPPHRPEVYAIRND